MKKWLFPIITTILLATLLISILFIALVRNGDGSRFMEVLFALFCVILFFIIVMPAVCFAYSRFCLSNQKHRFLYTLYQSFLIILPYLILFFDSRNILIYASVLFAWCELWALLGLVKFERKNKKTKVFDRIICEESNLKIAIRIMMEKDRECVLEMMRVFYASPAVFTDGSEEIFKADIDNCIGDSPYLEGYVFESEGKVQGYAMIAKSFSTEFGKPCMWIEDIYIKDELRGKGIGSFFLKYIEEKYPDSLFRLEVEAENERAVHVYKKCGYEVLPYMEMKK